MLLIIIIIIMIFIRFQKNVHTKHMEMCYGDGSNVSILLYADDIVLLSDNEMKMQSMLECLSEWCHTWGLQINFDKSKVMHFRASSKPRIEYQFKCGDLYLELVTQYKYLGVLLTKHLDYTAMTKMVAQSASRALGLLISKDKAFGGMPYTCYTKCFDATVQSIIDYSAALWGTKSVTCINAVQNRACRYFLGLGRYAPNVVVYSLYDMSLYIFEGRNLYFNCVFIYSTLHV